MINTSPATDASIQRKSGKDLHMRSNVVSASCTPAGFRFCNQFSVIAVLLLSCLRPTDAVAQSSLIPNSRLQPNETQELPEGFQIQGDVWYRRLDDFGEHSGWAVRMFSAADIDQNDSYSGRLSTTVSGLTPEQGRWFRFRIQAMAEDGFAVEQDELFLQVEFFRDNGSNSLDAISTRIYPQIERERSDLLDPGTNRELGKAHWRSYDLDFRTPFPEVDTLKLSVMVGRGSGSGDNSEFMINEFSLTPITPALQQPAISAGDNALPLQLSEQALIPVGGRWYFNPTTSDQTLPKQFDAGNADQLIYLSERPVAPFAGNMTGWLRKGFLDINGKLVQQDQFIEDNLVIELTSEHLVLHSKNLPNHPTAVFPDRWRALDGNPNYVQEQRNTWRLPLQPRQAASTIAMQNGSNENGALPMGPIGVAANGVVFFNPFDHLLNEDAIWRLDRCCGHPAPNSMYHYHKYPVCIKSPWSDDGQNHSPVIGFAFDGFPVYGPYEANGLLAKNCTENPLNDFNVHHDEQRGWHYHVTPGQFPHIIGGYWGEVDRDNSFATRRRSGTEAPREPRRAPANIRKPQVRPRNRPPV